MTVTDELKKYSLVALVVVIAYQVIGIILAALSGSAYVKGPALLAFFLNVVAASLVLCGKAAGKHTALAVLFIISAVMYVVEVLLTAILVLPRVGIFMSMSTHLAADGTPGRDCPTCRVVGELYVISIPFGIGMLILDVVLAMKALKAKKEPMDSVIEAA